jgi:hypothetical protein
MRWIQFDFKDKHSGSVWHPCPILRKMYLLKMHPKLVIIIEIPHIINLRGTYKLFTLLSTTTSDNGVYLITLLVCFYHIISVDPLAPCNKGVRAYGDEPPHILTVSLRPKDSILVPIEQEVGWALERFWAW